MESPSSGLGKRIATAEASSYQYLLRAHPNMFVSVPGKTQADDFILQRAHLHGSHIITNDQYRQYVDRYPWLTGGERLIKGKVFMTFGQESKAAHSLRQRPKRTMTRPSCTSSLKNLCSM